MFRDKRFKIITTYWFIGALILLILNDFVFKAAFHNWFTGKLSDFSGLFFFPLFISVFFPKQIKTIFISTALFFVFWKSPLSEGLIHWINTLPSFHYGRVIDYTDLIALSILPFSYFIYTKLANLKTLQFNPLLSIIVSAFAMLSTSQRENIVELNEAYYLQKSVQEVRLELLNINPLLSGVETALSDMSNVTNDTFSFNLLISDDRLCQPIYLNPVVAGNDSSSSRIYFFNTEQSCTEKCGVIRRCQTSNTKEEIMDVIESNFIDFL
jgi:hypothetical protein